MLISEFKSAIKPTVVVSQYISNNESTGSVSYTAKNGVILGVAVPAATNDAAPISWDVDNLAINGLVSNWNKLFWPVKVSVEYKIGSLLS